MTETEGGGTFQLLVVAVVSERIGGGRIRSWDEENRLFRIAALHGPDH
jgi:hypothetical protein